MSRPPVVLDGRTRQYHLISIGDIRLQNSSAADAVLRAVHERSVLHYIANGFGESTVFIEVGALSSLVPAENVSALVHYAATFPESDVMRWEKIPVAERSSRGMQSAATEDGGSVRVPSGIVSLLERGVGALERIADALAREPAPVYSHTTPPYLMSLASCIDAYWKSEKLLNRGRVRIARMPDEKTVDYVRLKLDEPITLEQAAMTLAMNEHDVIERLARLGEPEQGFVQWQKRALFGGRSAIAAQSVLYLALIKNIPGSRWDVASFAENMFHAPADLVRQGAAFAGIEVMGRGTAYYTLSLRQQLLVPVVRIALEPYR